MRISILFINETQNTRLYVFFSNAILFKDVQSMDIQF